MTRDELNELSKSKLERMAEDMGLDPRNMKKADLVELIASADLEDEAREAAAPEPEPAKAPARTIAPAPVAPVVVLAPAESAEPQHFKVVKAARYAVDGFCHTVPAGMIVSSLTHDVPLMRAQGVALAPMGVPTEKDLHTAPGRLGQLRALAGTAPEAAMDAFGGEAEAYYQTGPNGEHLPVEPIAVAANISISATLK